MKDKELELLMRKTYYKYLNSDVYDNIIENDNDIKSYELKLSSAEQEIFKQLKTSMSTDEALERIDNYVNASSKIDSCYRFHHFMDGFSLGLQLGLTSKGNDTLINQLLKEIESNDITKR